MLRNGFDEVLSAGSSPGAKRIENLSSIPEADQASVRASVSEVASYIICLSADVIASLPTIDAPPI